MEKLNINTIAKKLDMDAEVLSVSLANYSTFDLNNDLEDSAETWKQIAECLSMTMKLDMQFKPNNLRSFEEYQETENVMRKARIEYIKNKYKNGIPAGEIEKMPIQNSRRYLMEYAKLYEFLSQYYSPTLMYALLNLPIENEFYRGISVGVLLANIPSTKKYGKRNKKHGNESTIPGKKILCSNNRLRK